MFYQCQKCKKVWQYPIEKCPDCFLELERLPSKRAKVLGVSKVNIPTIFHQKTPYFVLVLEDENGNKWVQKSIREYKVGEQWSPLDSKHLTKQDKSLPRTELVLARGAVAVWRIKYDILEAIEKVVELLGGLEINSQTKILILPTLIAPKHPYFAVNTSPKFLESLINYLIKIGGDTKNIKVAAQSFDEIPIEVSAQKSQLLDVCLKNQITPLDLAKTNFIKPAPYRPALSEKGGAGAGKTQANFNFEISEEVFNSDLVINLPILKLDSKLGVKGGAENSLKFLKKESYLSFQYLSSLEEMMEKLQTVLPNYLTIADGLIIQKTTGFTAFLGAALASFNSLNLDRVFAEITLLKDLPNYLKKIKIEDVPIAGRAVQELQCEVDRF